jgi:hypothetical protein
VDLDVTQNPLDCEAYCLEIPTIGMSNPWIGVFYDPMPDHCACPFIRGDTDVNGKVNIGDAIATLRYVFDVGDEPGCIKAADADDNGEVNIGDAIYTLGYLFEGGPDPEPPFPECGVDETEDGLSCLGFAACP